MSGQRSEGMTTETINFYDDGSYSVNDDTFLDGEQQKGKYQMKDSVISLSNIENTRYLKSNLLLLKRDTTNNLVLYQLDKNRNIDTALLEFFANMK
jgi:hypothetical protein